jgi:signal transduction histidine kinase
MIVVCIALLAAWHVANLRAAGFRTTRSPLCVVALRRCASGGNDASMNLAELLATRSATILARWKTQVSGSLHPEAMPHTELIDHLPAFLDEIAQAMRDRESPDGSRVAAEHGEQRLALGFSLDGVVREYGALRDAILTVARAEQVDVRESERDVLFDCIITGVAEAVSEYQRQRDAELQRHMNEHFAFIAHELRNPLGSALSAVSMLEKKGQLNMSERFAQVLNRGLTRMHELIDSTLRKAQLATAIHLQREPVTLTALLEDMEMSASASAEERQVTLTFEVDGDVTINVDQRLVRSALTNLVRNAVKFSHAGGAVMVRARGSAERVVIEVEDSCGGLPPGMVQQAFAPFAQLGADRSGFGLGLAIAKQAADAHDGVIRVQDLPGKGCIFVLELPVSGS